MRPCLPSQMAASESGLACHYVRIAARVWALPVVPEARGQHSRDWHSNPNGAQCSLEHPLHSPVTADARMAVRAPLLEFGMQDQLICQGAETSTPQCAAADSPVPLRLRPQ